MNYSFLVLRINDTLSVIQPHVDENNCIIIDYCKRPRNRKGQAVEIIVLVTCKCGRLTIAKSDLGNCSSVYRGKCLVLLYRIRKEQEEEGLHRYNDRNTTSSCGAQPSVVNLRSDTGAVRVVKAQ